MVVVGYGRRHPQNSFHVAVGYGRRHPQNFFHVAVAVVLFTAGQTFGHYKGVRQFYHTRYHATKINIVNKLRTVSRELEVFLGEENMLEE